MHSCLYLSHDQLASGSQRPRRSRMSMKVNPAASGWGKLNPVLQRPLRGGDCGVLRLFENRKPAQIRVSEMNPVRRARESLPVFAPDEARPRSHHGVPPAHDVDIPGQFADLWMRL